MEESISDNPTVEQSGPGPVAALPIDRLTPLFPQLEVISVLGRGGMGVVYKARQKTLDRLVALKVLPPEADRPPTFEERFTREARALARLHHPNIVAVHDSGSVEDIFYLVMEYVDGTNLRAVMQQGRVEPNEALAIVSAVCDALAYAHEEGVAHRDIKPENILFDAKGRVKIADFGLAKLLARRNTDYALTAPQQVMGTMHYIAPEQIERPGEVDHRADLYSLGVVVYELLTGELPIGRFPLPSEKTQIDRRVDEIVLKALEKEPALRYQRASEIRTDLDHITRGNDVGEGVIPHSVVQAAGPPGAAPSRASSWGRRGSQAPSGAPAVTVTPHPSVIAHQRDVGIAYLLWCCCFFGFNGLHRMYAGKWVSGIIWLCTLGCFFIGQLIDLLLIPLIIRKANRDAIPEAQWRHQLHTQQVQETTPRNLPSA